MQPGERYVQYHRGWRCKSQKKGGSLKSRPL